MTESDEFLIVALGYCLTWEVAGSRAPEYWDALRGFHSADSAMEERERWFCELYEESSPTAQEERSIIARIEARLEHPRTVLHFRETLLNLIPEALQASILKHRLMNALAVPEGYGRIRTWLSKYKLAPTLSEPKEVSVPLAAREADFARFLEYPYFLEGFRKYWQQEPKIRNGRETRVLLYFAAAFSQIVNCGYASEFEEWSQKLAQICCLSEQTRIEILGLSLDMLAESYDAQGLAYRIFTDAEDADRKNFVTFCKRYESELNSFAEEILRDLALVEV